jgi:hypothetical protein
MPLGRLSSELAGSRPPVASTARDCLIGVAAGAASRQSLRVADATDLRHLMPLLEQRRSLTDLDEASARSLVEFVVCRPWPDYWVLRAMDWLDDGIWSEAIEDALRSISQNKDFSQETRHRAWRYVKPRPLGAGRRAAVTCLGPSPGLRLRSSDRRGGRRRNPAIGRRDADSLTFPTGHRASSYEEPLQQLDPRSLPPLHQPCARPTLESC